MSATAFQPFGSDRARLSGEAAPLNHVLVAGHHNAYPGASDSWIIRCLLRMLPFRSGDPEPRGGSQHLGLNSAEFHPVINCLLSAFPRTAVNSLALKLYNPPVPAGSYFSTCISAGLSGPSGSDLMLFQEGMLPASLGHTSRGYHLLCITISSGLQADLGCELLRGMTGAGNWPDVIVSLICLAAKPFRVHES